MSKLTITEALAELKTITKRIEKKKDFIAAYLVRQDALRDPLEKQGGSAPAVSEAFQSIRDLNKRYICIKSAISQSNRSTNVSVEGEEHSIEDWLTWKREIAPNTVALLRKVSSELARVRQIVQQKGGNVLNAPTAESRPQDFIVNLDEMKLADDIESLELILGSLDGKLSLSNATTTIEV